MDNAYLAERLPDKLPDDPMQWANAWLDEAGAREVTRNPNAMSVATVAADGQPSLRVVLCKQFVADPGYLVFYTNYGSAKAQQLEHAPYATAVFHWDALGRQVRLYGPVQRSPEQESDEYFASRGRGSQIGAWASEQSRPVASAAEMRAKVEKVLERFETTVKIPRPPRWGGYRMWFDAVELWVEGAARVHDRGRWERTLEADGAKYRGGPWSAVRLQP